MYHLSLTISYSLTTTPTYCLLSFSISCGGAAASMNLHEHEVIYDVQVGHPAQTVAHVALLHVSILSAQRGGVFKDPFRLR